MSEIHIYEHPGPSAGMWQQRSVPANLSEDYDTLLQNIMLKQGMPHARPGLKRLNGTLAGIVGNRTIHGLTTWRDSVDGDQIIMAAGTKLQRMPATGGDPEDLTLTLPTGFAARVGARTQFLKFNGCLYIINGTDGNVKYNGTSVTRVGLVPPVTLSAPSTSAGSLVGAWDYRARLVSSAENGSQESEPTAILTVTYANQQGAFSAPAVPGDDPQVDRWNLYRKPQSGSIYYRVNTTPQTLATTIGDNLSDLILQAGTVEPDLLTNSVPPGNFRVLCEHQGRLVGAIGNTLYFSDQGFDAAGLYFKPDNWPPGNQLAFGDLGGSRVTALVSFFTSLVVVQDFGVWEIGGTLADATDRVVVPLLVAPNSTGVGAADVTNVAVAEGRLIFTAKDRIYQIQQGRTTTGQLASLQVTPLVDNISHLYQQVDFDQGSVSIYDRDNKQWIFFGKGRVS